MFWRCHLSFFYLLHFLSFVSSSTLRVICIVWSVKYRMSVSVEEELQFSVESPVENVRKEVLETKHTHPCRSSATCLWSSWRYADIRCAKLDNDGYLPISYLTSQKSIKDSKLDNNTIIGIIRSIDSLSLSPDNTGRSDLPSCCSKNTHSP